MRIPARIAGSLAPITTFARLFVKPQTYRFRRQRARWIRNVLEDSFAPHLLSVIDSGRHPPFGRRLNGDATVIVKVRASLDCGRPSVDGRGNEAGSGTGRRLRRRRGSGERRPGPATHSQAEAGSGAARPPHAADGRPHLPHEDPKGVPGHEGRDAVGVAGSGADPDSVETWSERVHRQVDRSRRSRRCSAAGPRGERLHHCGHHRGPGRASCKGCRADRARARDRPCGRAWSFERGDLEGALGRRADRQVPPDQHLSEARRHEPHRGGALRVRTGPRRARSPTLR